MNVPTTVKRPQQEPQEIAARITHEEPRREVVVHQETRQCADHHQQSAPARTGCPTATCAPQNKAAAIRPTLAASPSILSSILNALVKPTIHSTVTAPPSERMGERPEQRDPHSASGQRDRAEELNAQPEPPVQVLEIVDQPHGHDHAGQGENQGEPAQLARWPPPH